MRENVKESKQFIAPPSSIDFQPMFNIHLVTNEVKIKGNCLFLGEKQNLEIQNQNYSSFCQSP